MPISSWFDVMLTIIGCVSIVVGMFMVWIPAGFLMLGVMLIAAAFVHRSLEVMRGTS